MHEAPELLVSLALSLSLALVLGLITHRAGLSPIVGYLLAGIVLGPRTPGFVADQDTAAQFAEIGVVLLMFGVGLHFHFKDLLAVRRIAVPGAVGQIVAATGLGLLAMYASGQPLAAGLVTGLAVAVASTVVLVRVLMDNDVLQTSQGRIAIGWLIVEDLFTVLALVALPALALASKGGEVHAGSLALELLLALAKVGALVGVVLLLGRWVTPRLLRLVARTRSRELFVLVVLALALSIALTSATIFGVSVALGAFLAGVIVGQSEVSHQAAADALPMRDAFAVLFFVSVGMLFDPRVIVQHPWDFTALLGVILLGKPLAALGLVWALGYSLRTGLTVAVGLAQIGEFSFILAQLGLRQSMISGDIYSLVVACALVSIAINPLLFRAIPRLEAWAQRRRLWRALESAEGRAHDAHAQVAASADPPAGAIIVGYGPVGHAACRALRDMGVPVVVIDTNIDTVKTLNAAGQTAVFGDATSPDILRAAGIGTAKFLLATIPDLLSRSLVVLTARELNPDVKVLVRARYLQERAWLEEVGATRVCYEELQATIGLTQLVLQEVGASEERIALEVRRVQEELAPQRPPFESA